MSPNDDDDVPSLSLLLPPPSDGKSPLAAGNSNEPSDAVTAAVTVPSHRELVCEFDSISSHAADWFESGSRLLNEEPSDRVVLVPSKNGEASAVHVAG